MKATILESIRMRGVMPFDAYMERCLYDADDGFFTTGRGAPGRGGDFVTSPEVSDEFGACVARWVATAGPSATAPLVEVGAGSGALLAAMDAVGRRRYAVERSPAARRVILDRLDGVEVAAALDDLPPLEEAVVVANELLDNLPVALARRTDDYWVEVGVGVSDGELSWEDVRARGEVTTWCAETFPLAAPGTMVTVQLAATAWIADILGRFSSLSMCLVDYASPSAELSQRAPGDLVRSFRKHTSPTDWLAAPGQADITVDVNIDAVVAAAMRCGATVEVTTQREFLTDHGARASVQRLVEAEQTAAREGRVMDQLAARSDRIDLEALLDPSGLGGFTVFLISKGTPKG